MSVGTPSVQSRAAREDLFGKVVREGPALSLSGSSGASTLRKEPPAGCFEQLVDLDPGGGFLHRSLTCVTAWAPIGRVHHCPGRAATPVVWYAGTTIAAGARACVVVLARPEGSEHALPTIVIEGMAELVEALLPA